MSQSEGLGGNGRRKARPILFSSPMVRALLDGRKTQTRRIVKPQPANMPPEVERDLPEAWASGFVPVACPYGVSGDLLWVREAHYLTDNGDHETAVYAADEIAVRDHLVAVEDCAVAYGMGDEWLTHHTRLRPSIHMPRWASRLTLEITDVRVERLQDISAEDADAECFGGDYPDRVLPEVFPPRDRGWGHLSMPECYGRLWEHINGAGSWDANPWVWAVSFKVHHANVDTLSKAEGRHE